MTTSDSKLPWQDTGQTVRQTGNSARVSEDSGASDLPDYHARVNEYISTKTKTGSLGRDPEEIKNWLEGEFSRLLNATNTEDKDAKAKVPPEHLLELVALIYKGTLSTKMAKKVFEEMFCTGKTAAQVVQEKGLAQISTATELETIMGQVIAANSQAVADFKQGKENALKFLVGQVMKATKGQANPQMVNELLRRMLAKGSQ